MFLTALSFLAGDVCLQYFSTLPSIWLAGCVLFAICLLWLMLRRWVGYLHLIVALCAGFSWALVNANHVLGNSLPKACEGQLLLVKGHIASIPMSDAYGQKFLFELKDAIVIDSGKKSRRDLIPPPHCDTAFAAKGMKIRLSTQDKPSHFNVGDQWQWAVKLKRIHGTQSPGAYDFEAWALQNNLRATGAIIPNRFNKKLHHDVARYGLTQLRQRLNDSIQSHLSPTRSSPWLLALIVGERNGMPPSDWEILRATGTNHLMAIAGLHIGLLAGAIYFLVNLGWRRFPKLTIRLPAQQAAACISWMTAMIYSAMAGFSIPTQRACIMLTIFILMQLLNRKSNPWHVWSLALLTVLIIQPLTVLSESFWLSFGTIALIIYGMSGRLAPSGWWWKWGRVQWVIGFGLIPLSLALFQESSLISFLANSIAIPWLAILVLPFCLMGTLFLFIIPPLGEGLLKLADISLTYLWCTLSWFSHLPLSSWQQAMPSSLILFLTIIAFILFLLPAGAPGRSLGLIWCLPLFLYQSPIPKSGELWMTVLDVGQGLSVVIQTKSHTLIYDTGPANGNINTGESVVLPFLRMNNMHKIDNLIISHGDNDHIGGASALQQALKIQTIQTSVPEKFANQSNVTTCLAGTQWTWDNIHFRFIYPTQENLHLTNDSSCVLKIESNHINLLLPGDIEKYAEKNLLATQSANLAATLIIAPHHGSKTSGIPTFIQAVHPADVIYATGYRNRYHFPHPSVVKTYEALKTTQWNTTETGTLTFKFGDKKEISWYRQIHARYWMD